MSAAKNHKPVRLKSAAPRPAGYQGGCYDSQDQMFETRFRLPSRGRGASSIKIELQVRGEHFHLVASLEGSPLFTGLWSTTIITRPQGLTGRPEALRPVGPWRLVCRHNSRAVGYLEASQEWSQSVTLSRHVLLTRQDGWLVLGEALTGSKESSTWQYATTMSVDDAYRWKSVPHHTEGWLIRGHGPRLRVLPVFACEWKSGAIPPPVSLEGGLLQVAACFEGQAFFAPLWLDFWERRAKEKCTWRHLTLGQNRLAAPPDVAAAYRVQVGANHWVLYRTLAAPAKRSFLGHQLLSELLFGRFDPKKGVVPLLELIEVPE